MDFRFLAAYWLAKSTKFLINKAARGGGTAAPGFFSLFLDANILRKLASGLETKAIITGTNGKTTTTRLIGDLLDYLKVSYIHNRHGSNLERGLISAFLDKTDLSGKTQIKTAVFEVDEAVITHVLPKTAPKVITITNLFRDQLDRYGEVDNIRKLWEKAFQNLDKSTTLILNADDPSLAFLGKKVKCRVVFFGLKDKSASLDEIPQAVDSVKCPNCYSDLKYSHYYISHQGEYFCPLCHFVKPELSVWAENIVVTEKGNNFVLNDSGKLKVDLETKLPGLFNIYNTLAAYTTAKNLDFNLDYFPVVVKNFKPAFGRSEKLEVDNRKVLVCLAKNPTGFNEVIRTFFKENQTVLIVINDLIADGRDISWLWDVNFEKLSERNIKFFISGHRSEDMALRLKYAGIKNYRVVVDLEEALKIALDSTPQNDTLLVVPTYTAMLELKKIFAAKGISGHFWED